MSRNIRRTTAQSAPSSEGGSPPRVRPSLGFGLLWVGALCVVVAAGLPDAQANGVSNTRHNLSASGPGDIKSSGGHVCVYCHTPHRAGSSQALWNRDIAPVTYNLYTSSTLEASLKQPTGSSRLCLSCHDGTTALGSLRVTRTAGSLALGRLQGRDSLGVDLSDDHPISFVYDTSLSHRQGQLADPASLSREVPLDRSSQLQCTSCHDPHEDRNGNFLRLEDRDGTLCTTCHKQRTWKTSPHAISTATWRGTGTNPWPSSPYKTVAENACNSCHTSHAAARPARLLRRANEQDTCLVCHDGGVATRNIERETRKASGHRIVAPDWTHDPKEEPGTMTRHVTCVDCHNPHQSAPTEAVAPTVPGVLRGVRGVNIAGGTVPEAQLEYEVCLKCHGDWDVSSAPTITRVDNARSIRQKIDPSNASYHPIAAVSRHTSRTNLEPGWTAWSTLYCTDCHNNDEWTETGSQPRGPHGSRYAPILEREYDMSRDVRESYQSFAMCYKCHTRARLFVEAPAQTFSHRMHVQVRSASCAICHDAHGSRDNVALLNFMVRDSLGRSVVSDVQTPSGVRQPEYVTSGPEAGKCYLTCHNAAHGPL